jgi:hypothetical protein
VRERIADRLGSPVVRERRASGGFSPGMASVLTGADGRAVFVKAVSAEQNAYSPVLYRQEAVLHRMLPVSAPAPRLLWSFDDGDWAVLGFAPLAGAEPPVPWRPDHLRSVSATARGLGTVEPASRLPAVSELFGPELRGWRSLAADGPPNGTAGHWWENRVDALVRLEDSWEEASAGDALLHGDLRADNVLLADAAPTPTGPLRPDPSAPPAECGVVLVDWAYACRGAAVFDQVLLLLGVVASGGWAPQDVLDPAAGLLRPAEADPALVLMAAFTGWFTRLQGLPPVPGLPALRPFQARMAEAGRRCLAALGGP